MKKKKEFTRFVEVDREWIVLKISLEEDKGDEPEKDELGANEVELVKIITIP